MGVTNKQRGTQLFSNVGQTGLWTPALTGESGGSGQTYSFQSGTFNRTGKLVNVWFWLSVTNKGTVNGTAIVTGLPFPFMAAAAPWVYPQSAIVLSDLIVLTVTEGAVVAFLGTSSMRLTGRKSGAASAYLTTSELQASGSLNGHLTYMTP